MQRLEGYKIENLYAGILNKSEVWKAIKNWFYPKNCPLGLILTVALVTQVSSDPMTQLNKLKSLKVAK